MEGRSDQFDLVIVFADQIDICTVMHEHVLTSTNMYERGVVKTLNMNALVALLPTGTKYIV